MKSFEYHVGGQPVRVIVEGVPSPHGRTQAQKAVMGVHGSKFKVQSSKFLVNNRKRVV